MELIKSDNFNTQKRKIRNIFLQKHNFPSVKPSRGGMMSEVLIVYYTGSYVIGMCAYVPEAL